MKCVMDSLEGIMWTNDSRVVASHSCKLYGDSPSVDVLIEEVGA